VSEVITLHNDNLVIETFDGVDIPPAGSIVVSQSMSRGLLQDSYFLKDIQNPAENIYLTSSLNPTVQVKNQQAIDLLAYGSNSGGGSGINVAVVTDIVARDALTPIQGDISKVLSNSSTYVYDGTNWVLLVFQTLIGLFIRTGTNSDGDWLERNEVSSDNFGLFQPFTNANIVRVAISCRVNYGPLTIALYTHDGNSTNLTQIGTYTMLQSEIFKVYSSLSMSIPANKQIAVKIITGNLKDIHVDLIIKGV